MEAIENLGKQPEKGQDAKNSESTPDVALRPTKPVPKSQNPAVNGVVKKQRTALDDLMHIQSLLGGYTLHDGLGKTDEKPKTSKTHQVSKTSSGASAEQNGPGSSEPPRVFISQRIVKRREKLPIFAMKQKFVEVIFLRT